MSARRVRVALGPFALDVDVDAWALDYGTDATAAAVRSDVLAYLQSMLFDCPAAENWTVEVRR